MTNAGEHWFKHHNADRRRSIARRTSLLLSLCCVILAIGVPASASGRSSFVVHTNYLGPSDASRIRLARAEANRLLSIAWYPKGARELSTWIHLKGFELSEPAATIGDPDQIDKSRFFLAGPKDEGTSWLNARVPPGGSLDGRGGTDRANLEWSYSFTSTAILGQSDLQYTKRILPDGDVEFRIDAQVAWTPQKSRFSIITGEVSKVAAVYDPGAVAPKSMAKMVAVSTRNGTTIATMLRLINALPVAYPGFISCPYEAQGTVTVSFFRSTQKRAFAKAYFGSIVCGVVRISQYSSSNRLIGTGNDDGGYGAVPGIVKLLGLNVAA
jgi:hypothetical protein